MFIKNVYHPDFPLNQFIDAIWVGKASAFEVESAHHAALFTELIFNYGDQFQVEGQNIEYLGRRGSQQIISGLKTAPFQTKVSGYYGNVGLLLKPFCYGTLQRQLDTKVMDMLSNILFEYVFAPEFPKFEFAEAPLLQLFAETQIDRDLLRFEKHISAALLQKGALKKFNLSLTVTQKSFIQKFKKHYILTPSQYVKLRQINHAIEHLQFSNTNTLTQIGLDAGFYDQSHFIRVFKKFCGTAPKKFIRKKESR